MTYITADGLAEGLMALAKRYQEERRVGLYFSNYMHRTDSVFAEIESLLASDNRPEAIAALARIRTYRAEIKGERNPEMPAYCDLAARQKGESAPETQKSPAA